MTTERHDREARASEAGAWIAAGTFAALAGTIAARGSAGPPTDPDGLAQVGAAFGVAMHGALIPVVGALPAPRWARDAGYAWIAIDIVANGLTLVGTDEPTTTTIRLIGHLGAAAWVLLASRHQSRSIRLVGTTLAGWLLGYTVLAPVVPDAAFTPAVPLMLTWLVLVARSLRSRQTEPGRRAALV